MTKWTYDPEIDGAYIQVKGGQPNGVKTVDLAGIHVMLDVDLDGNVLGIELLGWPVADSTEIGMVENLRLNEFLKEEPNGKNREV